MAHQVICKICGKKFDRDKEQAVKCGGRRYAHIECFPEGELVPLGPQANPKLKELKDYISDQLGEKANWKIISKQIKDFKEKEGYSYSGILKTLKYCYEVKNMSKEKSNGGIGIVNYQYKEAYNYYYQIFLAQELNKNKTLITKIKEIIIQPPQNKGLKNKNFDMGEWE